MNSLKPEIILKGLKTKTFGQSILCLEKVSSTNDVILNLAQEGCSEGTVVLSESQTKGRGRQGRHWVSTVGKSLAFSILLRPSLKSDELPEITLAAAVAVAKTMESFRLRPKIKWPNDLLLGDRKVCGILTEMGPKKDKMVSVVLGIGINLNQSLRDFPKELREIATSFYRFSGRRIDRIQFFQELLRHLEETYHWVVERRFPKVLSEWRKRSVTLDRQVKVSQGHHVFHGQVLDLDEKGALLVRNDLGIIERVTSADVELLTPKKGKRPS